MSKFNLLLVVSLLVSMQVIVGLTADLNLQTVEKKAFKVKGFHLDLRVQVLKPASLHQLANQLVDFGVNTLVMEWEANYPYGKHAVISNELSYTKEEIDAFIAYCSSLNLEVIPLQQCLGHVRIYFAT